MLQSEVHLRNYINIIRKYDFVIAVSFLLISGSAFVVSLYLPKAYEASTLVLIKESSSNGSTSSTDVFQNILSGKIEQDEMETLKRRFLTESLIESTFDKLESQNVEGVKYIPSVRKLKKCIYPEIVPDTRYIKLSVRLEEEEGGERNAALLANALIEQIQKVRSSEKVSKAKYRKKVLENKLNELENQIVGEEEKLHSFMKNNGIPTVWQAKFSKLLDDRSKLLEKIKQAESSKLLAKLELDKLKELEYSMPKLMEYSETVSDNPMWINQVNNLRELEYRMAGVKTQAGEESPELQSLLAQKEELEKQLKEIIDSNSQKTTSITKQLSPIYLSLVDRKIGLEIGIERAEEQLKTYEEQIQEIDLKLQNVLVELSENQFEFGKISRNVRSVYDISQEIQRQMIELEVAIAEVAIDENAYETLDVVESGLKVGESTTRGGIEVIDKAYPEKIPVSPRINFISAIAGIIGLAVGLAAAFVLEYFDNTYKIPDNIRSELGVDIIGVIPKSKSEDTLVQSLEPSVIESYNVLASNVDFLRISNGNRAIMLTSSIQAENKSNVVANLGISMSKANNKVLIVDANLRNGLQHSFFNLPPSPGLTDLLKDPPKAIPETIHTTEYSNLYLLPTGFLDTLNPLELLSSDNIPQLIKDLEYSYDVVLFDTSPIFPLVDVLVLAPKLNECILIADLEKTPRNTIIRAKERLDKVDINLLGLICSRGKGQSFDVFYT